MIGLKEHGAPLRVGPAGPEPSSSADTDRARAHLRSQDLRDSRRLRILLVVLDLTAATVAWGVVLARSPGAEARWAITRAAGTAALLAAATVGLMAAGHLYRTRVCSVRSTEAARIAQCAVITALGAGWLSRTEGVGPSLTSTALGAVISVLLILACRIGYGIWLRSCRTHGRYCRKVCLVGTNDEAQAIIGILQDQRELGYRVVAVVGDPAGWDARTTGVEAVTAGPDVVETVRRTGVTGAIVAASAFSPVHLEQLVGRLVGAGIHVQLSSGLRRVGHHRMSACPLSHQMLYYVERARPPSWHRVAKRAVDVAGAMAGLIMSAPILVFAAIAIKLDDGGSVLYRQERVGRDGALFKVLKFRTMVPDAAARVDQLAGMNERRGPLFKLSDDPRVTRAGRLLRDTSVDELPQLINVLRGEMSLVGPRPALPKEVAQFDDELRQRDSVAPGLTGLWQIEARNNPSFDAYRRLDLFYVDNWSIGMDLSILVATVGVVISGIVHTMRGDTGRTRTVDVSGLDSEVISPDLSPATSEPSAVGR